MSIVELIFALFIVPIFVILVDRIGRRDYESLQEWKRVRDTDEEDN